MSVGSTGWFGGAPTITPVARVFSILIPREDVTATVTLQVVSAAGTVAVPTLGQWGLLLLGSLLLLPGLRRLRHRH